MFGFGKKKPIQIDWESFGSSANFPHTPDYATIQLRKSWLVFIADEMMTGQRHNLLVNNEDTQRLCTGYTVPNFVMFKHSIGKHTYPVIMHEMEKQGSAFLLQEPLPVKGEVYAVRPSQLVQLDIHKQNGVLFQRERVRIDIPYREVHTYLRESLYRDEHGAVTKEVHEPYEVIHSEWCHNRQNEVFMYLGKPEVFFWGCYKDPTFKQIKPKVPKNADLRPYYEYSNKEDVK